MNNNANNWITVEKKKPTSKRAEIEKIRLVRYNKNNNTTNYKFFRRYYNYEKKIKYDNHNINKDGSEQRYLDFISFNNLDDNNNSHMMYQNYLDYKVFKSKKDRNQNQIKGKGKLHNCDKHKKKRGKKKNNGTKKKTNNNNPFKIKIRV